MIPIINCMIFFDLNRSMIIANFFSKSEFISWSISCDLVESKITICADNAIFPDVILHMWRSNTPVTPLICRIESFMSLYNKLEGELSIKMDIDLCNKYQTRGIMNRARPKLIIESIR
jgi:hypothetical protein